MKIESLKNYIKRKRNISGFIFYDIFQFEFIHCNSNIIYDNVWKTEYFFETRNHIENFASNKYSFIWFDK